MTGRPPEKPGSPGDDQGPAGIPSSRSVVCWADEPTVDLSEVLSAGIENHRPHAFPLRPLHVAGAVIVLAALGVGALALGGFFDRSRQSVAASTTVATTSLAPATTLAPTTAAPTTTAPTTTTTATTTTLPPPYIEPVGEPLELTALSLSGSGIGDLGFGDPAAEVFGVLAASLGQPDADSGRFTSHGNYETCPGDVIRAVVWGPLLVMSRVDGDLGELFYAFRLEATSAGGEHPAAALQTASGLRLGDTVAQLETMYAVAYTVTLVRQRPNAATFEIQTWGRTLLWGPISSPEPDGIVEGIFSPVGCPA